MEKQIGIYNTYISPLAVQKVSETLASTFISEGKLVKEFEQALSRELGLANPVALNSGTTALHLALDLAGIGEGDEVILPAQTFVATGLVILQQKAIPVFADINYEDGNISISSVRQKITPKTKAILCVHWGGYPCDMDGLFELAKAHNLIVIEDAAHALGAFYKNRAIGSISPYTCFSFQAIKHLTTGDGGALAVTDPAEYTKALTRRWFGINRDTAMPTELGERSYDIAALGYKYHLNDYGAALGLSNLLGLKERLLHRKQIARLYSDQLKNVPGIQLFSYAHERESANWLFGMHVENRLSFIRKLKARQITASVIHQRIDRNSIFGGIKNDLVNQEKFDATQIHIPMHDAVSLEDAQYIIKTIQEGW